MSISSTVLYIYAQWFIAENEYFLPDGTPVLPMWTGDEPLEDDDSPPYWILTTGNAQEGLAIYQVDSNGAIWNVREKSESAVRLIQPNDTIQSGDSVTPEPIRFRPTDMTIDDIRYSKP